MSNDVPSILYKYRAFSINSLDSLINDTVYLADPVSFNDPFDCQPSIVDDLDEILKLREIATTLILSTRRTQLMSSSETLQDFILHQNSSLMNNMFNGANPLSVEDEVFTEEFARYEKHVDKCDEEYYEFYSLQTQNLINTILRELNNLENSKPIKNRQERIDMYLDSIKAELVASQNIGVLSLAENFDCPLMWAHYSSEHKGFCCGYRIPGDVDNFATTNEIQKVDYEGVRSVLTSQLHKLLSDPNSYISDINKAIYFVKAKKWEYENEYRMIGKPGLRKSPFILESVYFGLRCKESVKFSIMSALANRDSTVQFYQMKEVKGTFDLEPEPITLSNVSGLPLSYVK